MVVAANAFASALAALCRSVGVDARLVTGFIGIDFDERVVALVEADGERM